MNTYASYEKDVVLINPPYDGIDDDALEENLGLAYIAGYLREKGVNAAIHEMTGKRSFAEKCAALPSALVYGLSLYTTATESAKMITEYIRDHRPDALIYFGGPHPTALPDETLSAFDADGVITGEGEYAFYTTVAAALAGSPLRGVIAGRLEPILDNLPFPNRALVDRNHFTRRINGNACISLITSRGCPYRCLHCNSIVMGGKSDGIRFRSPGNIIDEIRYIKKLGYENIRFNDDNFTANPNLRDLLLAIAEENISFRAFGRLEHFSESVCSLLKDAGCQLISIGIESCNPDNLRFLRKQSLFSHLENLHSLKKYGIPVRASFMVGLPFDTDETIERYFREASTLALDEFAVYGLIPYPGTELFESPDKYHYSIEKRDFKEYKQMGKGGDSCFVMSYNDGKNAFSPSDVRRWHIRANELLEKKVKHMRDSKIG
jgi:anaerobic magnesium-protoporphyrin IX monomethyl ester cyclase